jgi:glycosyltransferase involved in cell wall biosynthesis
VERFGRTAVVVSPGVDLSAFRPLDAAASSAQTSQAAQAAQAALRGRLGLPGGLFALYVGALSTLKGADVFAAGVELAAAPEGAATPRSGRRGASRRVGRRDDRRWAAVFDPGV